MKKGSLLTAIIKKLRDDKKLEILVYTQLIIAVVIIFLSTGGISCDRSYRNAAGSDPEASRGEAEEGIEERMESILSSIEGAGKVKVMVIGSASDGAPKGVVVVAEGARDIGVRVALESAVTTLTGLDPVCVGVFPMRAGG